MLSKRLFPGPSNYTEKDYNKFLDEILNDKPLTNAKHLEPYRENIKTLFNAYNINFLKGLSYDQYNSWTKAIDDSVFIAEHMGDKKVNLNTIKYLKDASMPTVYMLSKMLFVLYCPEEMSKNIPEYLWFSSHLFNCSCLESHRLKHVTKIDVGHPMLNDVYNYFYEIYKNNVHEYWQKIGHHERIVSVILAYLHLNNMFDVKLLDDFINNIDTLYVKVPAKKGEYEYKKITDFEGEWLPGHQPYEQEIYSQMFNNMSTGFTKQKQLIR